MESRHLFQLLIAIVHEVEDQRMWISDQDQSLAVDHTWTWDLAPLEGIH